MNENKGYESVHPANQWLQNYSAWKTMGATAPTASTLTLALLNLNDKLFLCNTLNRTRDTDFHCIIVTKVSPFFDGSKHKKDSATSMKVFGQLAIFNRDLKVSEELSENELTEAKELFSDLGAFIYYVTR